jgi:hypothetical protein
MTQIFRSTTKGWINEVIAPLLLLMLAVFLFLFASNSWPLFITLSAITVGAILLKSGLPLWRNRVEIDQESIRGSMGNRAFNIQWKDVKAAWRDEWQAMTYINLATDETTHSIPMTYLDKEKIWLTAKLFLKPESLSEDAQKKLPGYKQWAEANTKMAHELKEPLKVKVRDFKIIGWVCVILFILFAILAWSSGQKVPALLFMMFTLLGAYLILCGGTVKMDTESIVWITSLGKYGIKWSEVQSIETDPLHYALVFNGEDKKLEIPAPGFWKGADREAMLNLLNLMTDQKGMEIVEVKKFFHKTSKNARIN